ncbi:MAG: MFS transporter [Desertimonas sp.]
MLDRVLDPDTPGEIRHGVVPATLARTATNAAYRFAPPFIAVIGRGLDVSVAEIGVALAITDLSGISSPLIGRLVDHVPRRWSMMGGLVGVGGGAALAAGSNGLVWLTIALLAMSLAKIVFDVGLGSWIADQVPFDRRSRVVGLTETSWALGLLVGVSAIGVITALSSWRLAYLMAGVAVLVTAIALAPRIPSAPSPSRRATVATPTLRMPRAGWLAVIGMVGLMSAAQTLFITFGPWLEDDHGFSGVGLAAVTFGLGTLELAASTTSAARTDRWGKERSVVAGTSVMIPAALAMALVNDSLVPGLILLGCFITAFEFAIVSAIPIGAELVPGSPGRGIGTMIACGTVGRAAMAIPATRLYEDHGIGPPALLGAAAVGVTAVAMTLRLRALPGPANP